MTSSNNGTGLVVAWISGLNDDPKAIVFDHEQTIAVRAMHSGMI